jgi:hypothetical protein
LRRVTSSIEGDTRLRQATRLSSSKSYIAASFPIVLRYAGKGRAKA